jgi:type II secretory pathway component PulJ
MKPRMDTKEHESLGVKNPLPIPSVGRDSFSRNRWPAFASSSFVSIRVHSWFNCLVPDRSCGASAGRRRTAAAFTLTEVIIAATLSSFILAGVLSAFLMLGRSSYLASGYSELEAQARTALDTFGNDARQAVDIRWNTSQSITLILPTATNATELVTYTYDAQSRGATAQCFYRVSGDAASTATRRVLARQVGSDFAFQRYKLEQAGVADNTAATDLETKQIRVTFRASRTGATTVTANQSSLSATYILRNKRVSN